MYPVLSLCLLLGAINNCQTYRASIFEENQPLCNDLTCADDSPHTACKDFVPGDQCSQFSFLQTSRSMMIMGHNGIRNKMAHEWRIGNMNILVRSCMIHWSKELEHLSKYFLLDCLAKKDVCDFLVRKDVTIGQNFYFSNRPPGERWSGRAIRSWYSELGYNVKSWNQFNVVRKQRNMSSFLQIIWPTTEFFGCAGARMFDGYMTACYYHPAITYNFKEFQRGRACTRCPFERPTCSRDFLYLCGLDLSIFGGEGVTATRIALCLWLTPVLLYISHFF